MTDLTDAPGARRKRREYTTQRVTDANKERNAAMCKALNGKTRLEIALRKYLTTKGVSADEIKAALESVKTAQNDTHFHLLWNLLDKEND